MKIQNGIFELVRVAGKTCRAILAAMNAISPPRSRRRRSFGRSAWSQRAIGMCTKGISAKKPIKEFMR